MSFFLTVAAEKGRAKGTSELLSGADPWTAQVWSVQVHWNVGFCFFIKYTDRPLQPFVSHPQILPTNLRSKILLLIRSWEFVDAEGLLYALFCAILYKGHEQQRLWYPWRVLEPIHRGTAKSGGSPKLHSDVWLCEREGEGCASSNPHVVQKSTGRKGDSPSYKSRSLSDFTRECQKLHWQPLAAQRVHEIEAREREKVWEVLPHLHSRLQVHKEL